MAPESLEGQPTDQRSDLYALGLILYELASGLEPFTGESALEAADAAGPRHAQAAQARGARGAGVFLRHRHAMPGARSVGAVSDRAGDSRRSRGGPPADCSAPADGAVDQHLAAGQPAGTGSGGCCRDGAPGVLLVAPPVRRLVFEKSTDAQTLPNPATKKLVAVLPFRFSGSADLEHVATGVAEALSAKLFGLDQVTVAPTSAIEGADLKLPLNKLARSWVESPSPAACKAVRRESASP